MSPLPPPSAALERLERQRALAERLQEATRRGTPYLAHLRLDTGVRELDVCLGTSALRLPGLALVDWTVAPLAEVFFTCDEGDDYELDLGDRVVAGRVLEKNLVRFERGALVELSFEAGTLRRGASPATGDAWRFLPAPEGGLAKDEESIPLRAAVHRRPFRSPLEVELDPAQQAVVDRPAAESVLVLGEAGFGKTTVALHRLVSLQRQTGRRFRGAVIVPTEGLRRLTQLMLERIGATGIEIWTYDRWAGAMARRVFKDLPRRESENTPSQVQRLKRHPALRPVLAAFAAQSRRAHQAELDLDPPAPTEDAPAVDAPPPGRPLPRARATRADLEHFFGDTAWMERVLSQAPPGVLHPPVVRATTEHTRVQFLDTAESTLGHVDSERLTTLDGRRLDEGTPTEDAGSVDVEDYAVIFELERLRSQRRGEPPARVAEYHCVLVDEAQELAPLELALIGRSIRKGGSVIVAGDAAQQVDPTACFESWDAVLEALGQPRAHRATLAINYRCPPDVTALARHTLDGTTPATLGSPSLTALGFDSPFHATDGLTRALRSLVRADATASVAVICRSAESARQWARYLRHGPSPRLALEGDFDWKPGVIVTSVPDVKGLEFDYVLVPDAGAGTYPATQESRRALYVAVTRATHRLVLVNSGDWSPLLPP